VHIRLDIAPAPGSVQAYAEDAVRNTLRMYKVHLDYSPQSLQYLDSILEEWKKQGAPLDQITKSLYAFGSYAGEVLLGALSGTWYQPEAGEGGGILADLPFLAVRLDEGLVWKPINLAFLVIGEDGHSFFRLFMTLLNEADPVN
jgi:hypothetical protein